MTFGTYAYRNRNFRSKSVLIHRLSHPHHLGTVRNVTNMQTPPYACAMDSAGHLAYYRTADKRLRDIHSLHFVGYNLPGQDCCQEFLP